MKGIRHGWECKSAHEIPSLDREGRTLARRVVRPVVCRWRFLVGIRDLQPRPCNLNDVLPSVAPTRTPDPEWVYAGWSRNSRGGEWLNAACICVALHAPVSSLSLNATHFGTVTPSTVQVSQRRGGCRETLYIRRLYLGMLHYYRNWCLINRVVG